MHIGEPPIDAVFAEAQLLVLDPHQMQHGCVDVVDLGWIGAIQWLVSPLITLPMGGSPTVAR